MREIKFRGRIANGLRNEGTWIYWGLAGTDMLDAIDGDSIGQYTGLKDKNGKEIYEGDILKYLKGGEFNRVVIWDNDNAQFKVGNCDMLRCDGMEIIGNIYENPELLED